MVGIEFIEKIEKNKRKAIAYIAQEQKKPENFVPSSKISTNAPQEFKYGDIFTLLENAEVAGLLEKAYQQQKGDKIEENGEGIYFRNDAVEVHRIKPVLFDDAIKKLKEMEAF